MNFKSLKESIKELGYTTSQTDSVDELNNTYFTVNKENTTYEVIKTRFVNEYEIRKLSNGLANTVYKCGNPLDCISYFS